MTVLYFLITLLLIFYISETIGLAIYCENTTSKKNIKRYIFLVPIVKCMYFAHALKEAIFKRKWSSFFHFLFMETNSLICLYAIQYAVAVTSKEKAMKESAVQSFGIKRSRITPIHLQFEQIKASFYGFLRILLTNSPSVTRFRYQ